MGNTQSNQQQQCEDGISGYPSLKPLCDPRFLTKMNLFFEKLKNVPEIQKKYDIKQEEIIQMINQLETLKTNYNELQKQLKVRIENIESRMKNLGNNSNEIVDNEMTFLLNDYVNFINELENM